MGNANEKLLKDPAISDVRKHFDQAELYMLFKIFLDLSERDYGVLSKETFLEFFPLTGLWGERLFDKFDLKRTGQIRFPEFLKGIAHCCTSSVEERVKFLFALYDIDNDGFIEKKEMITMLYNYPQNQIKFITEEIAPDRGEKLASVTEQRQKSVTSMIDAEAKNPGLKLEKNPSIVLDFEEKRETPREVPDENNTGPFHECNRDIRQPSKSQKEASRTPLRLEETKIQENGIPMDKSSDGVRKRSTEISNKTYEYKKPEGRPIPRYSTVIVDQSFVRASTVNSRVKEYAAAVFKTFEGASRSGKISFDEFKEWLNMHPMILKAFDDNFHQDIWTVDRTKARTDPTAFRIRYHQIPPDMKGILWKKGKKLKGWKPRYFELRDNFLFYYEKKPEDLPKAVFYLSGCNVERTNDFYITKKCGFVITCKDTGYPPRHLYCTNPGELDEWMRHLGKFQTTSIHERYIFQEKIGFGKFSIVYRAISKVDNKEVAIKVIDKSKIREKELEFILQETAILKLLDHPHIIKLIDTIEAKGIIYIIMELVRDGELFEYISNNEYIEEYQATHIMRQLLNAMNYIHEAGVIHRDMKPENVLLSFDQNKEPKDIKICDFGFARTIEPNALLTEVCGTPDYVAPEVLQGTGYNKRADIWSLGIMLYFMLRGRLPYESNEVNDILTNRLTTQITLDDYHWKKVSNEGKDLLMRLLEKDPARRIDIHSALKHPWIKNKDNFLKRFAGSNR